MSFLFYGVDAVQCFGWKPSGPFIKKEFGFRYYDDGMTCHC